MSEENTSHLEPSQTLDSFLDHYFAKYHRQKCYLGLLFQQGGRTMVQINVPAHDLPILLQAKPSQGNDPDSGKNRPEVKGHAEEIKQYILERVSKGKPWILGTLTANISPRDIELIELTGRGMCLVIIPRGVKLDITDGQHRKRAIHELIVSAEGSLIGDNDFPITLVLEGEPRQCQIDFRDMAQTRQLDKSLLHSFGEFEGRIGITKILQNEVSIFEGTTEKVKSSPSTKHKLIYTTNYIAQFVSCVFSGNKDDELKNIEVDIVAPALVSCLNYFFSECLQTKQIFATSTEDLTVEKISDFKEKCLLGRSVGLEILGKLLHEVYNSEKNDFEASKVLALAQLDWSRNGSIWRGNVVFVNNDSNDLSKAFKIILNSTAVRVAVNEARKQLGWM